ncbi:MAG: glycosyltransferase family 2 protein [Candidatus Pacebacteria bacterium]|nr:glycosyltransferase family 2 protein [Candidatus Paceibacterota bacterium]
MISVIIATRNRPDKIGPCLNSILKNSFSDFEVLVADQSDGRQTEEAVRRFRDRKVSYFRLNNRGKSKALNFLIPRAQGEILAFTDDDCLVSRGWLKAVNVSFKKNPMVVGLFGLVLPYQPQAHAGQFCPATVSGQKEKLYTRPFCHSGKISGNNMAYRKKVFEEFGLFDERYGPNAITGSTEDAEMMLRVLIGRGKILYSPRVRIYHNRWLEPGPYQRTMLVYLGSSTVCYSYYALGGHLFAKKVVRHRFLKLYWLFEKELRFFIKKSCFDFGRLVLAGRELWFQLRGSWLGFRFYLSDSWRLVFKRRN